MLYLGKIPIQAALFDLDGTLVHTHIDFGLMRSEMRRMAVDAGISIDDGADAEILEMVRIASRKAGDEAGGALRDRMWRRLEEIERDGANNPSLVAGADRFLAKLRSGNVRIGVVTRNCRAVSVPLLAHFDLVADVLLTRDDVARTKPDPAHLLAALTILGVEPGAAVMVGDHWLDVQAGVEAGCAATIGVLGPGHEPSWFDRCPPTYRVRDLAEAELLFQ